MFCLFLRNILSDPSDLLLKSLTLHVFGDLWVQIPHCLKILKSRYWSSLLTLDLYLFCQNTHGSHGILLFSYYIILKSLNGLFYFMCLINFIFHYFMFHISMCFINSQVPRYLHFSEGEVFSAHALTFGGYEV